MLLISKFKTRVNVARLKTKLIAAVFTVGIASVAAAATIGGVSATPSSQPDCNPDAVIWCGFSSTGQLTTDYNNGDGHNSAASIHDIFNAFGISSGDMSNINGAVSGYVTKSGDVYVNKASDVYPAGDDSALLVASGAMTGGRQNISGSTAVTSGSTTFYKRAPSVSFLNDELAAVIVMKDGVFQFAVLTSCGNPITAQPKMPHYSITKQVRADANSPFGGSVTVKSGATVQYQVTIKNDGPVPISNITARDVVPAGLTFVKGSFVDDGQAVSDSGAQQFFTSTPSGGVTNGTLAVNQTVVLSYAAVAGTTSDTDANCKAATLTNIAYAGAPGLIGIQSSATVTTTCTATPPPPPPPAKSELACVNLTFSAGTPDSSGNTQFTFTGTASANNASITAYNFDFGDSKTAAVNSSDTTATATHTYAPGNYMAKVSVAGKDASGAAIQAADNPHCSVQISVKAPTPPTPTPPAPTPTPPAPTLPNTGTSAGSVVSMFVGTVVVATIAARLFLGRKVAAQR